MVPCSTTPWGFPCCYCLPLPDMPSPIPRRDHRLWLAHFTCDVGLPRVLAGSASAFHFSRPAQRSLRFRPACSPSSYFRAFYTRGFSRFVTSATAPVATGRSESCRAGFAPAESRRLLTAHDTVRLSDGWPQQAKEDCGRERQGSGGIRLDPHPTAIPASGPVLSVQQERHGSSPTPLGFG